MPSLKDLIDYKHLRFLQSQAKGARSFRFIKHRSQAQHRLIRRRQHG